MDAAGGAKILTGVVPSVNQSIVHVGLDGVSRFGKATVDFAVKNGELITTVMDVVLP